MGAAEAFEEFMEDLATRVAEKLRHGTAPARAGEPSKPVPKAEAAKALGIHISTLDRAVRAGCPFHQFNGRRRFDIAACRQWFETNRTAAATPDNDPINIDPLTKALGLHRRKKK